MNLHQQLKNLHQQEKILLKQIEANRANKTFPCMFCGKRHKFKTCHAIQDHYYVPPSGCTDGAYWLPTNLLIICPITNHKNRILFAIWNVPYEHRTDYDWDLNTQFKQKYKHLFKSVTNNFEKDTREWENNEYIQKNYKKYDLHYGTQK